MRYSRCMGAAAILRYLAVPLRMAPLLLIGTFSVLLVVAVNAGFLGIPLGLILLSWFSKYSFVLMDRLAEGVVEPPVLSTEMVNPLDEQRPLILLVMTIGLFYAVDAASYWVGGRGALVLLIAVGAILPAVVAVQGATGTVVQSLNPRRVLGLIGRLRGDYLLILGFIALVWLFSRCRRRVVDRRCTAARAAYRIAHVRVAGVVLADRRRVVRAPASTSDSTTSTRLKASMPAMTTTRRTSACEIARSIASTPNGAAVRMATRGIRCSRSSARAATRSPSCAGSISARRNGPMAVSPIVWRASCCRGCWPSAAPARRSISCVNV